MNQTARIAVRGDDGAVHWSKLPAEAGVVGVAHEYLQVLLVDRLRSRSISAAALSQCLGGTPALWRLKLKGERRLTLDDVLGLIAAVDTTLLADTPLTAESVADLVPPEFRAWLVKESGQMQLPRFKRPTDENGWGPVATQIDRWWQDEVDQGRDWAITLDVLAHEIVCLLSGTELSPRSVASERISDAELTLEWLAQSTSVRLCWPAQASDSRLNSSQLQTGVAQAWRSLADHSEINATTKICVLVAPSQVKTIMSSLLHAASPSEWVTLGLTESERLGIVPPDRDLHVRAISPDDPSARPLWCQVK